MAIDNSLVLIVFALSSIPFLILGSADILTGIYKKRIFQKRVTKISELPFLVRLHGMLVRKASIYLLSNVAIVITFFGFPILLVEIIWPQDLLDFVSELLFWIIFWSVIILFRVACNSPDPTGGLMDAFELLEIDVNKTAQ